MMNEVTTRIPVKICCALVLLVASGPTALCAGRTETNDDPLAALQDRAAGLEAGVKPNELVAYWDNGLRIGSRQGDAFKLRIGGRLQNDWAAFDADKTLRDSVGELESGTEFRRANLYVEGSIYHDAVDYKMELEFSGGAAFEDAYIALKNLPFGTLRFGHDEEEFSMEELTSNKYITFMERALPNALKPGTNTGVSLRDTVLDRRLRWAVGVYRDTGKYGEPKGTNDYAVTARLSGLPVCRDEGRQLLHLGVAGSVRRPADGLAQYRAKPESHLAPDLVDTGTIAVDRTTLFGAEAAVVRGPVSLQGEYVVADTEMESGDSARFSGFYVLASYFITGEHRPYDRGDGVFGRVIPCQNFSQRDGTWGAFELVARYSCLDLQDDAVNGGTLTDVTAGLNWYLNANTRLMFNYVMADAGDSYDGQVRVFQMRAAVDF